MIALAANWEADEARWRCSVAAAVFAHALMLAVVAFRLPLPRGAPGETTVPVDVIGAREFERLLRPPPPPQAAPLPAAPAPANPSAEPQPPALPRAEPPPPPAMIRGERMLSAAILAAPRNAKIRATLPTLADEERMTQLCNIEAIAQVHAWRADLSPDLVVAHARAEPRQEGDAVVADGAAIRIARRWRAFAFRCDLDAARRGVVGFAFQLGEAIPRRQWEAYNLPAKETE